jgi:hypothetical protein
MKDNFWSMSDGESVSNDGNFEMGGGSFKPIPEGTTVNALCTDAQWYQYEDSHPVISLTWEVLEGDFKSRKVFQKLKVNDNDDKKADKAKKMLVAIDANAGGKLLKLSKKPEDVDLATCLSNRSMLLKLGVWEINGKKGNWVMAVAPSGTPVKQQPVTKPDFDDGIPF